MVAIRKKPENEEKLKKKRKKEKKLQTVKITRILGNEKEKNEIPSTSSVIDDKKPSLEFDSNTLRVLRYRIGAKFNTERHLFMKKDASNCCSLIVANVPPYITPDSLGRILTELGSGNPDEVIPRRGTVIGDKITEGYYTASARFKTEYAVERALEHAEMIPCLCLADMDIELARCGVGKSCDEYRSAFKTTAELQESVDSYIQKYDAQVLEQKRKAKRMANVPDEEGWITVTKSHYKPVPPAIVVRNKDDLLKLSKKKKKVEENIAFYSFQLKQSKVKHLEELRRKFAEDKKKLAIAKAARNFRPN